MFTPDQKKAASELVRVCRPGGKIGLANWTPESFIGALFKTLGKHIAPPPGVQSPALWGTKDWIDSTFSGNANSVVINPKSFMFRYQVAGPLCPTSSVRSTVPSTRRSWLSTKAVRKPLKATSSN